MRAQSMMAMLMAMLATDPTFRKPSILSHKIEAKKGDQLLSKRKIRKMKGKRARKNRGNNRG